MRSHSWESARTKPTRMVFKSVYSFLLFTVMCTVGLAPAGGGLYCTGGRCRGQKAGADQGGETCS